MESNEGIGEVMKSVNAVVDEAIEVLTTEGEANVSDSKKKIEDKTENVQTEEKPNEVEAAPEQGRFAKFREKVAAEATFNRCCAIVGTACFTTILYAIARVSMSEVGRVTATNDLLQDAFDSIDPEELAKALVKNPATLYPQNNQSA